MGKAWRLQSLSSMLQNPSQQQQALLPAPTHGYSEVSARELSKMEAPIKMVAPHLLSLQPSQELSTVAHCLSLVSRSWPSGAAGGAAGGGDGGDAFPATAYSPGEIPLQELSHRSCPQ